ncbi:MAG: flagellar export chaperone FliS [Geminicoccaceae bacterium]
MTQLSGRAVAAYGRAAETLPPAQQILMLYDGAARRVEEIKAAIAAGDVEARYRLTRKAAAIVDGLQACLDHEQGGEIARLLDRLYTYVTLRLAEVNTRNDPGICDEILARLADLRTGWAGIAQNPGLTAGRGSQPASAA